MNEKGMDDDRETRDREWINALQKRRRARLIRVDYFNASERAAQILASLKHNGIGGDYSDILNRIVEDWAERRGRGQ